MRWNEGTQRNGGYAEKWTSAWDLANSEVEQLYSPLCVILLLTRVAMSLTRKTLYKRLYLGISPSTRTTTLFKLSNYPPPISSTFPSPHTPTHSYQLNLSAMSYSQHDDLKAYLSQKAAEYSCIPQL